MLHGMSLWQGCRDSGLKDFLHPRGLTLLMLTARLVMKALSFQKLFSLMKLTISRIRKSLQKSGKIICLISSIVYEFTRSALSGGSVCGPYAGTTTLVLAAVGNGKKFISLESGTFCFKTAIAGVVTISESIENSEKEGGASKGFQMEYADRPMSGSGGQICEDEEKWTCEEGENEIIVFRTTTEHQGQM